MSDYDRKPYYRRTKFYQTSREGNHSSHYGGRPYNKSTGFSKHEREYRDSDRSSTSESKERPMPQPTILLKARDPQTERSVSPKRPTKENEAPQSSTHNVLEQAALSTMTHAMKLIDDGTLLFESIQEYLQDSTDFLVVGVLGSQGTGKSTILNLIAQNMITDQIKSELFNLPDTHDETNSQKTSDPIKILTENVANLKTNEDDKDVRNGSKTRLIFDPQSCEQVQVGSYGTSGVDLFVTSNRVILLDCQPCMSAAALEETVQSDFKRTVAGGEFLPMENSAEVQSLQLATFMLSVCHIVLIVEDWFLDSNVVRFLQTAEMLKPSMPMNEEEFMDYFPHVMIVHNRATLQDFTPAQFGTMQQVYREIFAKSKLRLTSGMGLGVCGSVVHGLDDRDAINLFLLPEYEDDEAHGKIGESYRGHPGMNELVRELRSQVHGVQRMPLLRAQLTERNWLHLATRVWDGLRKSSFFLEYSKLMP